MTRFLFPRRSRRPRPAAWSCAAAATVVALAVAAAPARANPYMNIASSFWHGHGFDVRTSLSYGFDIRHSIIKREDVGLKGADPNGPIPQVKDLLFFGARHTLVPKVEVGLFKDLSLSVALPIVLYQSRRLEFDQRASPCVFANNQQGRAPTCINADNSTTVQDGLLPASGFDSNDPNGPGFTNTSDPTIFRGPTRAGLDQLYLGLAWAAMNQRRDDTKPTWKLGAQLRLAIGAPMRFDRANPSSQTSVGRGIDEIRLWTSMAKRIRWAEPYVEIWWQAPLDTRGNSQFIQPGYGQDRISPQQQAATRFGFEAIAWEKPAEKERVAVDFHGLVQAKFEGRAYTDMWEVFQYAGDAAYGGPLVLDANPLKSGKQALSYPGVSNVENYLTLGGGIGVDARLGDMVNFATAFSIYQGQSHAITYAEPGIDRNGNNLVDAGTSEVNPLHVPLIDSVGHRYRVDGGMDYAFTLSANIRY